MKLSKQLLIFIYIFSINLFVSSCQKNTIKSKNREIVDYYNGIVVDENKKLIKNVEVKMYTVDQEKGTIVKDIKPSITYTNDKGYFRINDKSIDILHVQTETKMLVFNKKGYQLDSVPTNIGTSSYRPKYDDFEGLFFIFKTPDTVTLHKCTDEYRKLK
ncbi:MULTISPECIES: hypothetical protein [unclassified Chryseobacterium]|uniref:hypothetical protein n=1 Tax=unclassified Chryseobacterium TaxID=2593645 RepID=UPI002269A72A|nr:MULTISPECIES: hypothetical protein [unclassified Chryseobacterium]